MPFILWFQRFALIAGLVLGIAPVTHAQDGEDAVPANPLTFSEWLGDLRNEAEGERGIDPALFERAFANVELNPRVIELDRRQPEFTLTFQEYLEGRLTPARIERGREQMEGHRGTLRAVAEAYNVQPRFIAAIWGMETNYGSFTGGMSVIRSLATLAYDMRRSDYFRNELLTALEILDEGHIDPENMKGSWAGAMGQSQFMPSSFTGYAQDFDGDGRRDIWLTEGDVFASIANYLSRYGWRDDMTWGREVRLPENWEAVSAGLYDETEGGACARAMRQHTKALSLAEWQDLGIRRADGRDLPERDFQATLVIPGEGAPAYLTYTNFRALLRYNCSNFYALAVGQLADTLRGAE